MQTTKICKFQSSTPSQWREKAEERLANQEERRMARKIAMQILNAMEKRGMSETALAERIEISKDKLSSYLKGHLVPPEDVMGRIRDILGVPSATRFHLVPTEYAYC